jgi:hypothetical protein
VKDTTEVRELIHRVDDYGRKKTGCRDVVFETCIKGGRGAGDGRTSVDCRVPVCWTPLGYRVPGLLKRCALGNRWARIDVEQIYDMKNRKVGL